MKFITILSNLSVLLSLIDPLKIGIIRFHGVNMKFTHYILGKTNFYVLVLFFSTFPCPLPRERN